MTEAWTGRLTSDLPLIIVTEHTDRGFLLRGKSVSFAFTPVIFSGQTFLLMSCHLWCFFKYIGDLETQI